MQPVDRNTVSKSLEDLESALRHKRLDVREALANYRRAKKNDPTPWEELSEVDRLKAIMSSRSPASSTVISWSLFDVEWKDYRAMMRAYTVLKQVLHGLIQ